VNYSLRRAWQYVCEAMQKRKQKIYCLHLFNIFGRRLPPAPAALALDVEASQDIFKKKFFEYFFARGMFAL
jgi:hypothetical protein